LEWCTASRENIANASAASRVRKASLFEDSAEITPDRGTSSGGTGSLFPSQSEAGEFSTFAHELTHERGAIHADESSLKERFAVYFIQIFIWW